MNELLAKKERLQSWLKYGALAVVGLIVSPIVFLSIKGIVGLAVAALLGLSIVTFTPWVVLKFANWKYRAIEHEKVVMQKAVVAAATENPIETLRNVLAQRKVAIDEFDKTVVSATAARNTFKTKLEKFAAQYPQRAPEFEQKYKQLVMRVEQKKKALKDARASYEAGELKLEEMIAYWEMSKDVIALNEAAGMDTKDIYEKLKTDTAVDAVFDSMNLAFAQLEVDNDEDVSPELAQLSHSKPVTLELQSSTADMVYQPIKQTIVNKV